MRTFLGKSVFYWPLMVQAEQWQCSLYANVLPVQSSVPTMFLQFLAKRTGSEGTGPACSEIFAQIMQELIFGKGMRTATFSFQSPADQ